MRGMAREYAAGNARGPGWREFAGTLGQSQAGRQAGSGMARSRHISTSPVPAAIASSG